VLAGLSVKALPYLRIKRSDFFKRSEAFTRFAKKKIGYPMIIKPARLGSSIGIKKVNNDNELFSSLCEAFNYDDKVICEPFLDNARDLNCAVYQLNGKAVTSNVEEALRKNDILSFADKYGNGEKAVGSDRRYPDDLSEKIKSEIRAVSKKIYRRLDFSSIVRFDFLLCGESLYLNEINAVPGSMAYYLFCNKFEQFKDLLSALIEDGVECKHKEDNYVTFYKSQILFGDYKGVKK
jgi:D-alanine-D-alanine ligase